MAKNGGKRPGAGRPKGTTNKPRLLDHFSSKEIDELVKLTKDRMAKNDKVLVHVIEQIFGKPLQSLDMNLKAKLLIANDDYTEDQEDGAS